MNRLVISLTSRKFWIGAGLFGGICFLIGFLIQLEAPKVRSWVLLKLSEISERESPVRIMPTSIELHLLPLGVTLRQVHIVPKKDVAVFLEPVTLTELEMNVSWIYLLRGRLQIDDVIVRGAHPLIHVPAPSGKKNERPLDGLFHILSKVPVESLSLENVDAEVSLAQPLAKLELSGFNMLTENRAGRLSVEFSSDSIFLSDLETHASARIEAQSKFLLEAERVVVSELKLRRGESYLVASGTLLGDTEALKFKEMNFDVASLLALDSTRNWIVKTFPEYSKTIPPLHGQSEVEVGFKKTETGPQAINFKFHTHKFALEKFLFDEIEGAGTLHDKIVDVPKIEIRSSAGTASVIDLKIDTTENMKLSGTFKTLPLEIHEVLKNFSVGDIPVWLKVQGRLPCQGVIKPDFKLTCSGEAHGTDALVRPETKSKKIIVALKDFSAKGSLTADEHAITYSAELSMPHSHGLSSGKIEYETGFKIGYTANNLDMRDIANLSDLKLEGVAEIRGITEGNSKSAIASMSLEGKDLWLENYSLGAASTDLIYANSHLNFKGVKGHYENSKYDGEVDLNLHDNTISVVGKSAFLDVKDLLIAFGRKVKLPFESSGTGSMQIKVWGPFAFTSLSYDLKSNVQHGQVALEKFEQANFDIHARNGEVTTDRVQITKEGGGLITMTGVGHPDGNIQTVIHGQNLHLENLNTVLNSGLDIAGLLEFDMNLNGYVLKPDTTLKGNLTKVSVGDQAISDSDFHLKLSSNTIEGGAALAGDIVKAEFIFPLNPQSPFALRVKSHDWNFAPLFSAIAGPASRKDYEAKITSDIQLSSPSGGFWTSSGVIQVDQLSLRRGSLAMATSKRILMSMNNGRLSTQSFSLEGENTYFRISDNPSPINKIDLQVNGKMDLSLFALVLPFFEDLRGNLSMAFNLRAGPDSADILGSAYVDKGFLKIFNFPHPFEEIKADVLFNQKKVLINSLKGEFAGGRFNADGLLELKGYKNYPLAVNATMEKVSLNVPDGAKTNGSGQLTFSGNWFPFLMKGTYTIESGLYSKEFGGDTGDKNVRRSFFLPQFLLQEDFNALNVDLAIDFENGITVKNSKIDGRVTGAVTVKGAPSKPSILGTINLDTAASTITFRDLVFKVTAGVVKLTDPQDVNPKLYITANSRIQEYDVTLVLQGTAQKPEIILSSSPALSQQDIISLIALGTTTTQVQDNQVTSAQQGSAASLAAGNAILQQVPVGKELKDRFGVNLQFTSGMDETNTVAQQKITLSGQLSPKLTWIYNKGVGTYSSSEAKLKYRLTNHFSMVGRFQDQQNVETTSSVNANLPPPTQQSNSVFGLDLEYNFEFK
jgi:translocation and assembly module TamB